MMLGAASHGHAHRRPGQDGRFPTHLARVGSGSYLDDGAALSRDSTAPPPWGKGLEKVTLKKLVSPLSCQHTAADWTSSNAVETNKKLKMI